MTTQQMISSSPSMQETTLAWSDNFILTVGGVLNIYKDLTEADCRIVHATAKLRQIQFARAFNVSDSTFEFINHYLLLAGTKPAFHFTLNGFDAVNDLSCLHLLPALRSLTVDMFKNNQLDNINRYAKLTTLGLGGDGISIKSVVEQKDLEELFLFDKLKDVEVIGSMKSLKKITFSKMTLKNLDFLTPLPDLKELHFMLGSATNYERLPEIGKIEKLSFFRVGKLTTAHLLPINHMKFLKELKFGSQPHLTDLDWLSNKNIKTEVTDCKAFGK